jgi:DNA-binding NarL/FixJ family response regulator
LGATPAGDLAGPNDFALSQTPIPLETRHTIAIVDDQIDIRDLLHLRIGLVPGLEVIGHAADGAGALALARRSAPDLMILDLRMPAMSGAEAIPLLRAVAPQMRIVVYTSNADDAELTKAGPPDAIVLKGGRLADLVAKIRSLLAEGPKDPAHLDPGRMPVHLVVDPFDS